MALMHGKSESIDPPPPSMCGARQTAASALPFVTPSASCEAEIQHKENEEVEYCCPKNCPKHKTC